MEAFIVLGVIGAILGLVLAISSEIFYVEVDNRVVEVTDMLPGVNCGACGEPGCSGMAEKLVEGVIALSACKPAKKDALESIKVYLETTPGPDGECVKVKM